MDRLRTLTRRQGALVAGVAALCLTVVATALAGHLADAVSLVAVLLGGLFGLLLLLTRRLAALRRFGRDQQRDLHALVTQSQRRLDGAVAELVQQHSDRHQELIDAMRAQQEVSAHRTDRLLRAQSQEVEALVQLFQDFSPRAPMPSSGGFALNPTDLLDLLHLIKTRRPQLVLELGSGTSSVWIAYALERCGGRLISLDHDPGYAAKTRAIMTEHGLTSVAEVRDAPLRPVAIEGRNFPWYDTAALADLDQVDLLLIDGPPEKTGPDARYPALTVLEGRLADTATIVFDDAHRPDEQIALRRWIETIEGLTEEGESLGRHAVLSYRRIVRQFTPAG